MFPAQNRAQNRLSVIVRLLYFPYARKRLFADDFRRGTTEGKALIDEVQVQNLALIEQASLELGRGLTVLTGETGAGKTALLSAMQLLMGERADKLAVREGCDELTVCGRFYFGDEELVAIRRVNAEGRSKVSLNGTMASVSELQQAVAPQIDLCGQNEHQQLTKPATHVGMLDAWAGQPALDALQAYQASFAEAKEADAEIRRIMEAQTSQQAKIDEARFVLQRIEALHPVEGEYEELVENLNRAEHAELLAMAANQTYESLQGEDGALDALYAAQTALDNAGRYDASLQEMAGQLREATYQLEDVAQSARAYRDTVDFDPETLEQQHARMAELQGLMRAYGPRMEDVFAAREAAASMVALVDDVDELLNRARERFDAAEAALQRTARELEDVRSRMAPAFAAQVTERMHLLEMGSAQLVCQVEPLERHAWTAAGSQSVEFLFSAGGSMLPRPLAKIASGGEISRVMLAIKAVLGETDNVDTLVFDEVDAGVGGNTANALAAVLADLSATHQVIVVTHLAQVAVKADTHYVVSKTADDFPRTVLTRLSPEERPAEIARMLSGEVTPASLAHAAEMLERA